MPNVERAVRTKQDVNETLPFDRLRTFNALQVLLRKFTKPERPAMSKRRTKFVTRRMAEREGFEPPVPFGTTVFKTAAFDHSAISP
tara:strand:- start:795 stop:1052 length:258 start_codon:yes stop_codon:yes gene_type:complete